MTNWQSQPTAVAPRRREIVERTVLGLVALATTVWMFNGTTTREAIGTIACAIWAGWMLGDAIERTSKRWRVLRELAEQRARNTGTWTEPGGESFTVRWEPSVGWYVQGFIGDHMFLSHEERWPSGAEVAALITAAQHVDGFVPATDEGTRSVQARLDLPGWDRENPVEREVWTADENVRDLTGYRDRFKPGPY